LEGASAEEAVPFPVATRRFPLIVETLAPARALLHHRRRSCRL